MHISNLSYEKKNQYLLFGSLVFLILAYLLAIQKTVDLWEENDELNKKLVVAEKAPMQIKQLQNDLELFNSRIGTYLVQETDNQERIVQAANEFCQKNNLILREIPALTTQKDKDFEVLTTQIVAQGTFAELLKMVHYFERHNKIARVTSVKFEKAEDYKTRKSYLSVRIYLQNIKLLEK